MVMTFIGRSQSTMAQWVELRLIFKVCTGEKRYEGVDAGGRLGRAKR